MFNIYFISAGWMPISFGKRKTDYIGFTNAESKEVIYTSYINYVKDDLDKCFNLDRKHRRRSCELDLEGEDIKITATLVNDNIDIRIKYLYTNRPTKFHYVFNYKEFLKEYVSEFESYKQAYLKEFHYDEPYLTWNNWNYKSILSKIKN